MLGVFFGVEIILREFSIDVLGTVMLSAMIADATAIPFLGRKSPGRCSSTSGTGWRRSGPPAPVSR